MVTQKEMPMADRFLEIIKPDLLRVLDNAPAFGSCGIEVIFHDNDIVRLLVRTEYSRIQLGKSIGNDL